MNRNWKTLLSLCMTSLVLTTAALGQSAAPPPVNPVAPQPNPEEETFVFSPKHGAAAELVQVINELMPKIRSKCVESTNTIVARGSKKDLAELETLLSRLDQSVKPKPTVSSFRRIQSTTAGQPIVPGATPARTTRQFSSPSIYGTTPPKAVTTTYTVPSWTGIYSNSKAAREFRVAEERANAVARSYQQVQKQGKPDKAQLEKMKKALQEAVEEAFDARLELQAYEAKQLKERLAKIEDTISKRKKAKGKIVERRVEDLLGQELLWNPTASKSPHISYGQPATRSYTRVESATPKATSNPLLRPSPSPVQIYSMPQYFPRAQQPKAAPGVTSRSVNPYSTQPPARPVQPAPVAPVPALPAQQVGPFQLDIVQLEGNIEKAKASLDAARASLDLETSQAKRLRKLADSGAVQAIELQRAEAKIATQKAEMAKAEIELKNAERQLETARLQQEAQSRLLEFELRDAELSYAVAKQEYEESVNANKKQPGVVPETQVRRQKLQMDRSMLKVEKAKALIYQHRAKSSSKKAKN